MLKIIKLIIGQKKLNQLAFESQISEKPKGFEGLTFQFIDSNGKKYFVYHDIFNNCIDRKERIMIKLQELSARMSLEEIDDLFDSQKKAIELGFKNKDYATAMSKVTNLATEWEIRRKDIEIYGPVFIEFASLYYIREDENLYKFDEDIHQEKIKQFKKDYENIPEFFFTRELNQLLNLQEISPERVKKLYMESQLKIKAMEKIKLQYSLEHGSEIPLENLGKI